MTFKEYRLLSEAFKLKNVDTEYQIHKQAWLNFSASATDKKGKPRYKKFEKFFDYEKELQKAKGETDDKFDRYKEHLRRKNG